MTIQYIIDINALLRTETVEKRRPKGKVIHIIFFDFLHIIFKRHKTRKGA